MCDDGIDEFWQKNLEDLIILQELIENDDEFIDGILDSERNDNDPFSNFDDQDLSGFLDLIKHSRDVIEEVVRCEGEIDIKSTDDFEHSVDYGNTSTNSDVCDNEAGAPEIEIVNKLQMVDRLSPPLPQCTKHQTFAKCGAAGENLTTDKPCFADSRLVNIILNGSSVGKCSSGISLDVTIAEHADVNIVQHAVFNPIQQRDNLGFRLKSSCFKQFFPKNMA